MPKILEMLKVHFLHPTFIFVLITLYSNFLLNQNTALSHPSHTEHDCCFLLLLLTSVSPLALSLPGHPPYSKYLPMHKYCAPVQVIILSDNTCFTLSTCHGPHAR